MKLFLIGKNGQLGSEISTLAHEFGYDLIGFSRNELDVTDYLAVEEKIDHYAPDVVIDTAAYHIINDCEKFPEQAFAINSFATKNLATVCSKRNIRLITFSTDKVFDGYKGKPYTEEDTINPLQLYGLSMATREIISLNYNPNSIVIRTCGIFSGEQGSKVKKGNFVLYILRESQKNIQLEIASDQIVSVVNGRDLAKVTLELTQNKYRAGIYHVANKGYCSWADFAKEISKQSKKNLSIIPVERGRNIQGVPIPFFTALDISKVATLGIELPTWQDGLGRYLQELKLYGLS